MPGPIIQILKLTVETDVNGLKVIGAQLDELASKSGKTSDALSKVGKSASDASSAAAGVKTISGSLDEASTKSDRARDAMGRFTRTTSDTGTATSGLKAVGGGLDETTGKSEKARDAMGRFVKETEGAGSRGVPSLKQLGGGLDDLFGKSGTVSKGFEGLGNGVTSLAGKGGSLVSGLGGALDTVGGKVGDVLGKFGEIAKMGLFVGGGGALAGLGASVKVAADFEQALNNVSAATGATSEELAALRKEALQVGKDTSKSASESVEAFGELAKAGVSVKDIVGGVGRTTVELAEATGASVGDMATLLSNSLNTFGLGADKSLDTANLLSAAANASAIDVKDLGFSLSAVGPVAKQAHLSMADFATAVGVMGNEGLKGADAGTSLKTMLLSLTAPTDTAVKAMASIGLKVHDAEGHTRNFRDILQDVYDRTKDMADEDRDATFRAIFGQDAIRAANVLMDAMVPKQITLADGTKKMSNGWDEFGKTMASQDTLAQQTAKRLGGLNGALEQLKGSVETVAINVGSKLLPAFTGIVGGATNVINKLLEGDWSGAGKAIVDGLKDGLSGAKDLLGGLAGNLLGGYADTFFDQNGFSVARLLPGIVGILSDVVGQIPWADIWGKAQDIGAGILGGLKAAGNLAVELGTWLADQIGGIDWAAVWGHVKDAGNAIVEGLKSAGDIAAGLGDWLGEQVGKVDWNKVWGNIKGFAAENLGGGVVDFLGHLEDLGTTIDRDVIPAVGRLFTSLKQDVVPGALDAAKGAIEWLGNHQEVLVGAAAGIGGLAVAWQIYTVAASAAAAVTAVVTSPLTLAAAAAVLLGVGIAELVVHWDDITKKFPFLGEAADAVGKKWGEFTAWLGSTFVPGVTTAVGTIVEKAQDVVAWVSEHWTEIQEHLSGPIAVAKALIEGQFNLIKDLIQTALTVVGDIINVAMKLISGDWSGAWEGVKALLSDIWDGIKQIVSTTVDTIKGVLSGAWTTIRTEAENVWPLIRDAVTGAAHAIWQWLEDNWKEAIKDVVLAPFNLIKLELGLIGKGAGLLPDLFDAITGAGHAIWQWFTDHWGDIKDVLLSPLEWVRDHAGDIMKAAGNAMLEPIRLTLDGFKAFVGGVRDAVNWVGDKIGIKSLLGSGDIPIPQIPRLAAGTDRHQGGPALVGEIGPELAYDRAAGRGRIVGQSGPEIVNLPAGTSVVPAAHTAVLKSAGILNSLGIPNYFGGIDFGWLPSPGDIIDGIKKAGSAAVSFAREWLGKGMDALYEHALSALGVKPVDFPGDLKQIGSGIAGQLKDGVVGALKEIFTRGAPAISPTLNVGPGANAMANQILAWAREHGSSLGIDPGILALALTTLSAYETGLTDENNPPNAEGPFSFDGSGPNGGTAGAAKRLGFDIHTVSGSLDAFLALGDMSKGVGALLSLISGPDGGDLETAAHAMELAMERPSASVDATRVARGEFHAAFEAARSLLSANPGAAGPPQDGAFRSPVSPTYVTQEWGPNPNYATGLHAGIDLVNAPDKDFTGSPVYAAGSGQVVVSGAIPGWPGIGSHVVTILHPGDLVTLYAHMMQTLVPRGQNVTVGQQIGIGDNEGNSTGSHLHFETHRHTNAEHPLDGDSFNPRQLIAFADGGTIDETVIGRGLATGKGYLLGEAGPETVTPAPTVDAQSRWLSAIWDAVTKIQMGFDGYPDAALKWAAYLGDAVQTIRVRLEDWLPAALDALKGTATHAADTSKSSASTDTHAAEIVANTSKTADSSAGTETNTAKIDSNTDPDTPRPELIAAINSMKEPRSELLAAVNGTREPRPELLAAVNSMKEPRPELQGIAAALGSPAPGLGQLLGPGDLALAGLLGGVSTSGGNALANALIAMREIATNTAQTSGGVQRLSADTVELRAASRATADNTAGLAPAVDATAAAASDSATASQAAAAATTAQTEPVKATADASTKWLAYIGDAAQTVRVRLEDWLPSTTNLLQSIQIATADASTKWLSGIWGYARDLYDALRDVGPNVRATVQGINTVAQATAKLAGITFTPLPVASAGMLTGVGSGQGDGAFLAVLHPDEAVLPLGNPARTAQLLGQIRGRLPSFADGTSGDENWGTPAKGQGGLGSAPVLPKTPADVIASLWSVGENNGLAASVAGSMALLAQAIQGAADYLKRVNNEWLAHAKDILGNIDLGSLDLTNAGDRNRLAALMTGAATRRTVRMASGGLLTEPVTGLGMYSGQVYRLAETHPEWVTPASGSRQTGAGDTHIGSITITVAADDIQQAADVYRVIQQLPQVARARDGVGAGR